MNKKQKTKLHVKGKLLDLRVIQLYTIDTEDMYNLPMLGTQLLEG